MPYSTSCRFRSPRTMPGSTVQRRFATSTDSSRWQYFLQSSTTAMLQHSPPGSCRPAGQQRGAVLATDRHRLDRGVHCARDDHADRHLPVVGAVRGVRGAGALIEADLAVDPVAQITFQGVGVCWMLRAPDDGKRQIDRAPTGWRGLWGDGGSEHEARRTTTSTADCAPRQPSKQCRPADTRAFSRTRPTASAEAR